MRTELRHVRALRLDDVDIPISRGRLSLTEDELADGAPGPKRWSIYVHLATYEPIDTGRYEVRAELDDGETLQGPGVLTDWNGLTITLRSTSTWTGVGGW